jgi:hypothetical protein
MTGRQIPELERYLENLGAMRVLYRASRRYHPRDDLGWQQEAIEKLLKKAGRCPWLLVLPREDRYRHTADAFHFSSRFARMGDLNLFIYDAEHYNVRFEDAAILFPTPRIELIMLPYDAAPRMFFLNPYYSMRHVAAIMGGNGVQA